MIGFRTTYTDDPLPTGGPCFLYDDSGDITLVVHEPSLFDDPRGTLDAITAACHENVRGHQSAALYLAQFRAG